MSDVPTVFNYGIAPELIVQNIILAKPENEILVSEMGAFELTGEAGQGELRAEYYICSYSFVKYLIESCGMDAFMKIYTSPDEEIYSAVTGRTLTELQADWLIYLSGFDGELDSDSYDGCLEELFIQHGLDTD